MGDLPDSPLHLSAPLVRDGAGLVPTDYHDAVAAAARLLGEALDAGKPLVVVGAGDLTCEEAFVLARLAADVLNTPHRDCPARVIDDAAVWHLQYVLSEPYRVPPLEQIEQADAVVVLDSGLGFNAPQAYAHVVRARRSGASVVLLDCVDLGLGGVADVVVRHRPGGLLAALEVLCQLASGFSASEASSSQAARAAGLPAEGLEAIADVLSKARRPAVLATAAALPTPAAAAKMAELAVQLNDARAEWVGLYLLRSEANTLGAALMGLSSEARDGLSLWDLAEKQGEAGAVLIVGEDLARWVGQEGLAAIRGTTDGMVALAPFPSPTTAEADVVVPTATAGERTGTYLTQDGTLVWMEQMVDTEARWPAHQVIFDIAQQMGGRVPGPAPDDIWATIKADVLECRAVDLDALRAGQPQTVHKGMVDQPTGAPEPATTAAEPSGAGEGRQWILAVRRDEYSWAFDPRVRAAALLERDYRRHRRPYVYMHPNALQKLEVRAGSNARVETEYGGAEVELRPAAGVPESMVVLPWQFVDAARAVTGGRERVAGGGWRWPEVWCRVVPP